MDACHACKKSARIDKVIACSGSCGRVFQQSCAGINRTHFTSWTARVGLFWFCESCRLNFVPAAYDRDKIIMKALRELLIRMDSMDTRLGNYGENLRKINRTLYTAPDQKARTTTPDQSTFLHDINQLNFNDSDDPINRSRSCDETSFFEILDEINSTVSQQADKFIVGVGKRVKILQNAHQISVEEEPRSSSQQRSSSSSQENNTFEINNNQHQATLTQDNNKQTGSRTSSQHSNGSTSGQGNSNQSNQQTQANSSNKGRTTKPRMDALAVARPASVDPDTLATFYISPFVPDQSEDDVKKHICEISNADPSTVKVIRLVARVKTDLTYVSFKASVPVEVVPVVGDQWYWPEGVRVRPFELRSKNEPATLQL